ncbi:MAG: amidase [Alphaproteobacteria bacterium]|nr:amidase [Alphaproteobacteria bacterium]
MGRCDELDSNAPVIESTLARIAAAQPLLNTFIRVDGARARVRAETLARSPAETRERQPLFGMAIGIKDVIDVAGLPTSGNSRLFTGAAPALRHSVACARLEAAGAIIVGKLHCWELSVGGPCDDTPFPPARNPWDTSRDPGGSSSGAAAAVAAGLVPAAIGGDTGGSIRLPASCCGVVGFKPSHGRIPLDGVLPFAPSLDVIGPIARNVATAARVTSVLLDQPMPIARSWAGCRIGIPIGLLSHASPCATVAAAFEAARRHLEALGASVVDLPFAAAPLFNACYFVIARSEAYSRWRSMLEQSAGSMCRIARRSLALGALVSAADHVDATRLRTRLTRDMARLFETIDVLCLPTTPDIAGPLLPSDGVTLPDAAPYTRPFSLVGAPAVSLPCGLSPEGLPIGLQFVGRWGDDAAVLSLAHHLETSPGWAWRDLRPDSQRWT